MSSRIENSKHGSSQTAGEGRLWSLRSALLTSHLFLISLVVFGFGLSLYWTLRWSIYRQVEADLLAVAHMLVKDLEQERDGDAPALTIPETYFHRFGPAPRDHAYVALWDDTGKLVTGTDPLPPHALPVKKPIPRTGPHPFVARAHGHFLDVIVPAQRGGQLLVGRPLAKEYDALWRLVFSLVLVGSFCLLLGGMGAWWLARRLARPLTRMSDTAQGISSRNLSQRLQPPYGTEEAASLALGFNSMLDGLQAAFERQARFTADASHELRTPVSVILSQSEHSLSRERSIPHYQEALTTCRNAAQRMRTLVDDLLLLARADSGHLSLRHEAMDLAEVVQSTVEPLQSLADGAGIRLELQLAPAHMQGDPVRLGQVASNLVTNAIKYNVPRGDVLVRVQSANGQAILTVQDHGQGIPLEDQPNLFERFYRVDRARTHEGDTGSGLGLSLVAEIVAAHRGVIEVASEPGVGTTMTVRVPSP
ncbi:HAMP domain-containing sensor histidine kinase [Planctomicrobium piriforme]|uniref:histidine kinase n=1 Tax=Planctomicrobium piriforme TaxID=1576369 RepID=A0A1I3SLY7_9PLAN|nr:ATP-binding protein [Planctomicrobium piriforme]SFJ59824.1 heavy metal sensor kinase [Planctomicrobium piriforme]